MYHSREQGIEKVSQYWPAVDLIEVLDLLDQSGGESGEKESDRAQLAILKLSQDDIERLPGLIRMARFDFRNRPACAKFPEEMNTGVIRMDRLPSEQVEAIRRSDRDQFPRWLEMD